jgi:hypothetical protein
MSGYHGYGAGSGGYPQQPQYQQNYYQYACLRPQFPSLQSALLPGNLYIESIVLTWPSLLIYRQPTYNGYQQGQHPPPQPGYGYPQQPPHQQPQYGYSVCWVSTVHLDFLPRPTRR